MTIGKTGFTRNPTTDAPLHDESVTAVRDEPMDVSDKEVSNEDGCLFRSMATKAYSKIVRAASAPNSDTSYAFDASEQGLRSVAFDAGDQGSH